MSRSTGPTPIVLVSGPPASGKTFVADVLAESLVLPLLAKDRVKEVLYDALGTGDVAWSQRLGRTAMALVYDSLEAELRAGRAVIVEANFDVAGARPALIALRERWPFASLEVHCTADTDVLVSRYTARAGSRHAGHLDSQRVEEITRAIVERRNGSLELGPDTMILDTTDLEGVNLAPVVDAARAHLARHGHLGGRRAS